MRRGAISEGVPGVQAARLKSSIALTFHDWTPFVCPPPPLCLSLSLSTAFVSPPPRLTPLPLFSSLPPPPPLDIKVLSACALESDLQMFPDGDRTYIGERGITLSGGQKARLSLARCVYSAADVYLLDDPLSAVDATVGKVLFNDCICGLLKGTTRVLVTHQTHHLVNADLVLILDEAGNQVAFGTYKEVLASGSSFLNKASEEGSKESTVDNLADSSASTGVSAAGTAKAETSETGSIALSTYKRYFAAVNSGWLLALLAVVVVAPQVARVVLDLFIADWVGEPASTRDSPRNIGMFVGLTVTLVVLAFCRTSLFMYTVVEASRRLHDRMYASVTHATMQFFHDNPIGRILNRFSKDTGFMDDLLPWTFLAFIQLSIQLFSAIILVSAVNPWVFLMTVPLICVFALLRRYYLSVAREVKRIEAVNRSPMYSYFNLSLLGASTIRSHNATAYCQREMEKLQDQHGRCFYTFVSVARWFGFRLDYLTVAFLGASTFAAVAARGTVDPALIALSLTQALRLTGAFQWCVRQSAELENHMTSVERVLEYGSLPSEEDLLFGGHGKGSTAESAEGPGEEEGSLAVSKLWPDRGSIVFRGVSMRYSADGAPVLRDISFSVAGGEHIGVVGRTGAGKSSLLNALFRLSFVDGHIFIDGHDTAQLPLETLRSNIGVIPQDPLLFRYALPPCAHCCRCRLQLASRVRRSPTVFLT